MVAPKKQFIPYILVFFIFVFPKKGDASNYDISSPKTNVAKGGTTTWGKKKYCI
jgi:hypothetical protein